MKTLEEMSIGMRVVITIAVVLIAVLLLAIFGYLTGAWEKDSAQAQQVEQIYQGMPLNEHLLALDKRALEAAYHDQLKLLFSVWLKEDVGTTNRINNGLRKARRTYALAAEQIEKREHEMRQR